MCCLFLTQIFRKRQNDIFACENYHTFREYGPSAPSEHWYPLHCWSKFLILIHSELNRTIRNHSGICIRANTNQSELTEKYFSISFVENRSKINPTQSKSNFQSAQIRVNPDLNWWSTPNQSEWIRVRIEVSDWIGMIWIDFRTIFNKRDWKLFSDWFALARIKFLNDSE